MSPFVNSEDTRHTHRTSIHAGKIVTQSKNLPPHYVMEHVSILLIQDRVSLCSWCPGTHYVDQIVPHSQRSVFLCLLSAGIKDDCHHHLVVVLFLETGSSLKLRDLSWNLLCTPGWPQMDRDPPTSASQVLGLKTCVTTSHTYLLS